MKNDAPTSADLRPRPPKNRHLSRRSATARRLQAVHELIKGEGTRRKCVEWRAFVALRQNCKRLQEISVQNSGKRPGDKTVNYVMLLKQLELSSHVIAGNHSAPSQK